MKVSRMWFHLAWLILVSASLPTAHGAPPLLFVSAFEAGEKGAIYAFEFDGASGKLTHRERNGGIENPFFLAISPNYQYLYSNHAKSFGSEDPEEVVAFRVDRATGKLALLNRQSSRGSASCYLQVDATGRAVLLSNFSSGSVASLPIEDGGRIGELKSFFQHVGASKDTPPQDRPHPHCMIISPDNRFAYVADLGLDKIFGYELNSKLSTLTAASQPYVRTAPGAGPRHLTFHPNGKFLFAIHEISNAVTCFRFDAATGFLIEQQTISTLPADSEQNSYCADLKITPDGRFLYGTNRGHNSIAAYRISDDGTLTLVEIEPSLGAGPQNLAVLPGGRYLACANMPGQNLAVFQIDPATGALQPNGPPIEMPSPSCIQVIP